MEEEKKEEERTCGECDGFTRNPIACQAGGCERKLEPRLPNAMACETAFRPRENGNSAPVV